MINKYNRIYVSIKKCIKHKQYLNDGEIQFIINMDMLNIARKLNNKDIRTIFYLEHKINKYLLIERISKKKEFLINKVNFGHLREINFSCLRIVLVLR